MITHEEIQTALRTHLLTLSVCESETDTIGVTASGYTREIGSWIDDGFAVGMEILAGGFTNSANNGTKVVKSVSDSLLTVSGCVVEAADTDRTVEVGLPSMRAWENVRFERRVGIPHVVEQYAPGPETAPESPNGKELRPMYFVQVFVPANTDIYADSRYAEAIKQLFHAKASIAAGSGYIRGRADAAAYLGQRSFAVTNFSMIPVNIPLRARTTIT